LFYFFLHVGIIVSVRCLINENKPAISTINMAPPAIRIEDRYTLNYSRDLIWKKLNDPAILAACIRGCAYVERESPTSFKAVIRAHIGEIKKDFGVVLLVDDQRAPAQYTLSSTVSAGLLGKVKGQAEVVLEEIAEQQTVLRYIANIDGTGLLGKTLPLIEGAAGRRVRDFFDQFVDHLSD
jgi:carbon monoxide dehydrogenase subunit G